MMKKSKILATLAATAVLSVGGAFALTGCGHSHAFEEKWTTSETHHWHEATCEHKDEKADYGEHVYDDETDVDCNTCGYKRIELTGTLSIAGYTLSGATVTVNGKSTTTDNDGKFLLGGLTVGTDLEMTVNHPAIEPWSGKVTIAEGSNTFVLPEGNRFRAYVLPELGKSYFELNEDMTASDKTDFPDSGTIIWPTHGNVTHCDQGTRLDIGSNPQGEIPSLIYQKFAITSANSKMMFRMRGFGNVGKIGVRVIDINGYTITDLKPVGSDDVWQTMDSASYFIPYEYDLSAYEGKDVVIIIGAKEGYDNVIERVKFAGESFIMPYVTKSDLAALEAAAAPATVNKETINDASWIKVGDQGSATEGWLFRDGPSAEDGATDLCVFTYKKLTFNGTKTVSVKARTFVDQTIPGHPNVPAQIVIKIFDNNGNEVKVNGNCYTIDTDSYQTAYISFDKALAGDYTFAIGMARGHRLAVDEIKFLEQEMAQGTVTGTVKAGTAGVEGVKVSAGAYSTTTDKDGHFDLNVEIYPGNSLTLTVEKEGYLYNSDEITVSADDLAGGTKALGDIALDKEIIKGLSLSMIGNLNTATASEAEVTMPHNDQDGAERAFAAWEKYNTGGRSNEGWLFRGEDKNIADVSTEFQAYAYKKVTLSGVNTITVSGRTFVGQNTVNGVGQVCPQIVIAVIDSTGEFVTIGGNCYTIATEDYETAYFALPEDLEGAYTVVVGLAKGRVLAIDEIHFKVEKVVTNNITGTVKDGEKAIAGAKVSLGAYSTVTGADGTFTLSAGIYTGKTATVKIEAHGYIGTTQQVSATDLANVKALGDISLTREYAPALTWSVIEGLNAVTAENLDLPHNDQDGVERLFTWNMHGNGGKSNEGWIVRHENYYAEEGSTDVESYIYQKLTFNGLESFKVSARTFGGDQNHVDGFADGTVLPQIAVLVIDKDGNLVEVGGNCVTVPDSPDGHYEEATLTFATPLTGDYTVVIGIARGRVMAIDKVLFTSNN